MATGRRANRRQTPVVFKRQKKSVLTEWGKIRSRRVTGLTVQQQRDVATVIKNAREMALLPYSAPQ
ncbi:30S ribosomal protein S18 [Mycobacterium barrassiae]|nr:30S ribosomal protein S18 [Mycobacterium barrassiae]MCV7298149.1 30S ribosomal protein S18 [Mycobacterium barrassiae]